MAHDGVQGAGVQSRRLDPRGADRGQGIIGAPVPHSLGERVILRRGARLFVCAYGCQKRRQPLSDKATNCGLVVLTDIINGTDRFVALN